MKVVVGTKSGELLVYDLATSSLVETIAAHTATVWSMQVTPKKLGMVTGSADKEVKFWEFEYNVGAQAKPVCYWILTVSSIYSRNRDRTNP